FCCFKPLAICPLLSCSSGLAPFFPVFPVWPGFCGRTLSWPAGHCPGPQSQWNPAPAAAWSTSPPGAGRIYLSFSLQILPPLPPAVQPPPSRGGSSESQAAWLQGLWKAAQQV
uniref:Uncharacterized protein n=1 Tax=Cyanistes caeruleus TaxID=156563 RepID=A0A8C0UHF3_CYACU